MYKYEIKVALNNTARTIEIYQNVTSGDQVTSSTISLDYAETEKLITELRRAQWKMQEASKVTSA